MTAAPPALNERLTPLGDGPFRKLDILLSGIAPAAGKKPLDLALGEPRHAFPESVARIVQERAPDWGRYPPMKGTAEFCAAVAKYLQRRYQLPRGAIDPAKHVAPIAGSREGLFLIAQVVVGPIDATQRPAVLIPNPYYVAYAGAAVGVGAEPVFVPATDATGHLPDYFNLPRATLARTKLAYLCSPANPQGVFASADYLKRLIALAREFGFVLAVDECYGEIYDRLAPTGALEACGSSGGFANVVVFHSLSKRSSVPGLRSGFVAGDPRVIAEFLRFRAYSAPTVPIPVLAASAALWDDDAHVVETRAHYRAKFDQAERALGNRFGFRRPDGTFFLWLNVGNGETVARQLWTQAAVRVMPGAYMGVGEGPDNPGSPYVRVALVDDLTSTAEAVERIAATLP